MRPGGQGRRKFGSLGQRARDVLVARRMRKGLAAWGDRRPLRELDPLADLATTVLLPCYNHAALLPLTVESLLHQTLSTFDSILIDDCSTDGTPALLERLAAQLAVKGRVTVLTHDVNLGQAATLNSAVSLADSDLVSVVNDDDWLTPTALEAAVGAHGQQNIALVGCSSRWFSGDGLPPEVSSVGHHPARRLTPRQVRGFRQVNDLNMTHSGMTFRRSAWAAVGGYRSDPGTRIVPFSDRDFQLRVAALYPVALIDAPLVWWRSDSSVDAGLNS